MRMQEQRFKEAKKAVVTPLMNHIATPSNLPQAEEEAWVEETLDSSEFGDRRLKKLPPPQLELEEVVVAAMEVAMLERTTPRTKGSA